MGRIPNNIGYKPTVCIICEGLEEKLYMDRLESLKKWNQNYDFKCINAKGASNVFSCYQNEYNNNRNWVTLVFCDTDKFPHEEYAKTKKAINDFHNKRTLADKITIFANPCTMQIILSHFGDVSLTTQAKKTNAPKIEELTGVAGYGGHEGQIKMICGQITRTNYTQMKKRVSKINRDYFIPSSTNFITFINNFESEDSEWIKIINKSLLNK